MMRGDWGFLGAESAPDLATGHGVTVSCWRGLEHADSWRRNPEHVKVIAMAYRWHSAYSLRAAVAERDGECRPVGHHETRRPGQER